jgi:DNA-binding NarL/FixJ family response regulator
MKEMSTTGPTTIALADDHSIVRLGLRSLLEQEKDFKVVGEAFDGIETVRMVKRVSPHVLILDLMMPGMNGMYVTSEVKQSSPQTKIIILSMHAGEQYVQELFSRGADGYVVKDTMADEIVMAVRAVMEGRRYVGDLFYEYTADERCLRPSGADADPYDRLTAREREVLYLVAKGLKNTEIADQLSISIRTAEAHRAHIMRKLNLRTQSALVQFALKRHILT